MLKLDNSKQFKKDLKRYLHQRKFIQELNDLIKLLLKQEPLDPRHRDHFLAGNWVNHRECHVRNDILLIYRISEKEKVLFLERLGSHSELFG